MVFPLVISGALSGQAAPAGDTAYFYQGLEYGSDEVFDPVTVTIGATYNIFQSGRFRNRPLDIDYATGAENVAYNLAHPVRQISRFGWGEFLRNEIIPLDFFQRKRVAFLPNYTMHLVGGCGITYRGLEEWYQAQGFPWPRPAAVATTLGYEFLVEAGENSGYQGVNTDAIADFWVFNLSGLLLFSSDRVAAFFSRTLEAADWTTPAMFDPFHGVLDNASQNYGLKIPLPYLSRWKLFAYFGYNCLVGASYRLRPEYALSGGFGLAVNQLQAVVESQHEGRRMDADLVWNAGLFLDRKRSLLASLIASGTRYYKIKLNVFPLPGLGWKGLRPAFFTALGQENEFIGGITLSYLPVGLSFRTGEGE